MEKSGSMAVLLDELCHKLENLAMHDFTHRWQGRQYKMLNDDLPEGWALTTMDFAENYLCVQQDQPQSSYFGYSQVTVHPTVSSYGCPNCDEKVTDNVIYLTDALTHDPHFIDYINDDIQARLQRAMPSLAKHVIFSDGCASQYKSKLPFYYLAKRSPGHDVERCFFGARHGKNPCDALGGIVKQVCSHAVAARQVTIKNSTDMFAFCQRKLLVPVSESGCTHTRRSFVLVDTSDYASRSTVTANMLKTIPGTRSMRSVKPGVGMTGLAISSRNFSCFCGSHTQEGRVLHNEMERRQRICCAST